LAKALELLKATGMSRGNYEPPLVSLLWRLGMPVPPPHFASFIAVALFLGVGFGVVWGAVMWFFTWSASGMDMHAAMLTSTASGLFFGIAMASFYAYGRRKHKLPKWLDL
jgi:hypothetical protein